MDLMMIKAVKILIFLLIVVFTQNNLPADDLKTQNYESYVNQITSEFAREMKKDCNLHCIGDGGRMPFDVEQIDITFICYKKASIVDARELEIKVMQKFLKKINEHTKIQPFLRESPFSGSRILVSIFFKTKENIFFPGDTVDNIININNNLHYLKLDKENGKIIDLLIEPYEDSLKNINKN